jgi:hypothetical protein
MRTSRPLLRRLVEAGEGGLDLAQALLGVARVVDHEQRLHDVVGPAAIDDRRAHLGLAVVVAHLAAHVELRDDDLLRLRRRREAADEQEQSNRRRGGGTARPGSARHDGSLPIAPPLQDGCHRNAPLGPPKRALPGLSKPALSME